jgi:hypothetical protein
MRSTSLVVGMLVLGIQQAQADDCFTQEEAKAAHLRALQQQFNVAALSCRTVNAQPGDPSFAEHYNGFVAKFDRVMVENARVLRSHFKRVGGNFDTWMTRVANTTFQRVVNDSTFCQVAWQNLESSLALPTEEVEILATSARAADPFAPDCPLPREKQKL